jgi:hypothetical protein
MVDRKGTGGKKGRSGRRSLSVEVERCKIRDLAWQRTGEMMSDRSVKEFGLDKVVGMAAAPLVKADMAKPIVIDNSQHTHITSINVDKLTEQEVVDLAMGRYNGRHNA